MAERHRHLRRAVAAAGCVVVGLTLPPAAGAQLVPDRAATANAVAVPGEAVVRFEPGTTAAERLDARDAAGASFERSLGVARAQLVDLSGDVAAGVERLERQPDVAYAQPNYRYRALAAPAPNDTFFGSLWGLSDPPLPSPGVNVLSAWDTTRGAGQVIAVVDTGVDLTHPDLADSLVPGFDFVDGDADPDDYDFHGTHVAGTIAAIAGNATGVAGVAPEARIMPVRVLDGDGSGSTADIADGVAYAAQNGATVINLSLGGPAGAGDQAMSDAIGLANDRDVVVVAAAGNDGTNNDAAPVSPCVIGQPNLLCVASVTQGGALSGFSNYGPASVDLGAPGQSILSARTDYATVMTEGFDAGLGAWTNITASGIPWGQSTVRSAGTLSAADSPAAAQSYAPNTDSQLIRTSPVSLSGQRGCRVHFALRHDIQPEAANGSLPDSFWAGAVSSSPTGQDALPFAGSTGGAFTSAEVSISDLDGRADVKPAFALFSNATQQFDGAYVDDLRLLCRDATYADSTAATGNYVTFSGTSMAAPHVAGVAALAGAADPGAPDTEIVQAIRASAVPLPALAGRTVTGGTADARGAIDTVLGLVAPPPTGGGGSVSPGVQPLPKAGFAPPRVLSASVRGGRLVVDGRGRVKLAIDAPSGAAGTIVLKTAARVRPRPAARARKVTVLSRSFVAAAGGTTRLRPRLSATVRGMLRRRRSFAVVVAVRVSDAGGAQGSASARRTLALAR